MSNGEGLRRVSTAGIAMLEITEGRAQGSYIEWRLVGDCG